LSAIKDAVGRCLAWLASYCRTLAPVRSLTATPDSAIDYVARRDLVGLRAAILLGLDVNTRDTYGLTALVWAARAGQVETVKVLLDAGADPNGDVRAGYALQAAMETYCKVETVRMLLAAGADVNVNNGLTPLMRAVHNTNLEIIDMLLRAGADVNARGVENVTALSRASMTIRSGVVRMLLSAGADANTQDQYGITPLMNAVKIAHSTESVRDLLDAGAYTAVRSHEGKTALDHARELNLEDVCQLLMSRE